MMIHWFANCVMSGCLNSLSRASSCYAAGNDSVLDGKVQITSDHMSSVDHPQLEP